VDELLTASWRVYPAIGLVLLGTGVVAAAVRAGLTSSDWRPGGVVTALAYLLLFRRLAVGLALAGVGVAWIEQVPWLLGASACIGLGELLETSFDIGVIRWGQRRAATAASRSAPTELLRSGPDARCDAAPGSG
jgi:hypothetical protein